MKFLIIIIILILSCQVFAQDQYAAQLSRMQREMERMGMQINPNSNNPFITGTALQGYYLNERILLLERDAYFMMKSNKLKTTEQVADFQHRLKVLSNHANNIILGMVRSLKKPVDEGFGGLEEGKHQMHWEELLESCQQDASCVNRKITSGEVTLKNDLIDSFELSLQIFKQIPYMHALEFASIYQLVQLLQMEVLVGQTRVANVEFDLFLKKEKEVLKSIDNNKLMTELEKEYHRTMTRNTIKKWKKKILVRKFDNSKDYKQKTLELMQQNQDIIQDLEYRRIKHPEIVTDKEFCSRRRWRNPNRKRCMIRQQMERAVTNVKEGKTMFLHLPERKLPLSFWNNI